MNTIAAPSRLSLVDALRGFALMGLFIVHAIEYFDLYWMTTVPSAVHDVIFFLFGGKAYAIFAMLFGVSFFIIMDKQAAKGIDFSGRFMWRLLILFALGYLHGLLYSGDILVVLALFGLSLVIINRLPSRWIFIFSLLCLINIPLIYHLYAALHHLPGANDQPKHWGMYGQAFPVWANGSFLDVIRFNSVNGQHAKWFFFFESGRGMQLFGLLMWGLLLGRSGFFVNPSKFQSLFKKSFIVTAIAAAALFAVQYYLQHAPDTLITKEGTARYYMNGIADSYFSIALMLVLVMSFVSIYQLQVGKKIADLLAPCGRMSLSIYIGQSIVCAPLFYGYGLGLYKDIGQTNALLLGIVLFAVQIVIAHAWMKKFYYGPLEWLWRAGTYLTLKIPLKR